jgi:hypothetical protein
MVQAVMAPLATLAHVRGHAARYERLLPAPA